jgi:hypothetical protein
MIGSLIRDYFGSLTAGILLAGTFTSCASAPAEMPYPTPRTTGFSSSCVSGEPIGGLCPEFLPSNPPVYQSNDRGQFPHRGSGRLYEVSEL